MSNTQIIPPPEVTAPVAEKLPVEKLKKNADWLMWQLFWHAQRQWLAWGLAGLAMFLFASNYTLGYNRSESLPYTMFLVHKGEKIHKGDLAAFPWDGGGKYAWMSPFAPGSTMVKKVIGGPGDTVTMDVGGQLWVNGKYHAAVKPLTKTGKPLTPFLAPGQTITIPEHKFYVGTDHKDGMDSRYDMVGLVDSDRFIGKVYALF